MRKNIVCIAASLGLILSVASSASIASEANNIKKTGYNSVTSTSASYASAVDSQVQARYDAGCLGKHSKWSNEYNRCLQHIPASAFVSGGGY